METQTSERKLGSPKPEKSESLRNISQYILWLTVHYHTKKPKAVIFLAQVVKKRAQMQHIQTLIEIYDAVIPELSVRSGV